MSKRIFLKNYKIYINSWKRLDVLNELNKIVEKANRMEYIWSLKKRKIILMIYLVK